MFGIKKVTLAENALEEIPYSLGFAAVDFNGNVICSKGSKINDIVPDIKRTVDSFLAIYKTLGEYAAGIPKEILLTTSELIILTRIFYNAEIFQTVILERDANLGFTRYKLHQYLRKLVK